MLLDKRKFGFFVGAVLLSTASAVAQTAPESTDESAANGDIIVTAQRRAERLQEWRR